MIPSQAAALFYIGVFALLLVILSVRVSLARRQHHVALGDGGKPEVLRAMRAQANYVEYAPTFMILLAALAFVREPSWMIHALALIFLAGRLIHAWAMTQEIPAQLRGRVAGMTLTWAAIVAGAVMLLGRVIVGPIF
ncbi:MAG: MAPEG family protein [Gemmatimonas sp.]